MLPAYRWLSVLLNLTNYVLMSVMAYEWFMFIAASEKMLFRNARKKRSSASSSGRFLPVHLHRFYHQPVLLDQEEGRLNPLYHPGRSPPFVYLLTAVVISLNNARKAIQGRKMELLAVRNPDSRRRRLRNDPASHPERANLLLRLHHHAAVVLYPAYADPDLRG